MASPSDLADEQMMRRVSFTPSLDWALQNQGEGITVVYQSLIGQ
jgi:hypothetical protein